MARIALDNGHGFNTAGKRTPNMPNGRVIREWQFNHATARLLKMELENLGHKVVMLSDTDIDTPLATRVKRANDAQVDLVVSIHYNAFKGIWGTHGGIETLFNLGSVKGQALAKLVQKEMIQTSNLRDRGIKSRSDLYILKNTKAPAILVEAGFMDNLEEANLMLNVEYQTKIAQAITKGIQEYLGIKQPLAPKLDNNSVAVNIKGKELILDGYMKDDINYVQIRPLLEGLGYVVTWDNVKKVVIAK